MTTSSTTVIQPTVMAPSLLHEQRPIVMDIAGWMAFGVFVLWLITLLPAAAYVPGTRVYLFALGALGIWRYSLRLVHFVRAQVFLRKEFPRIKKSAQLLGEAAAPSHVYLLVTSFRIEAETTAEVYRAALAEAIRCGWPCTLVASLVEMCDEKVVLAVWKHMAPPPRIKLKIVRVPGTGKRDGLAQGFRSISRDMPDDDAVVAVIDGDTLLEPGVLRGTAPYMKLLPKVGGLTTNEFCKVQGSYVMSEWHKLRFAQRHMNMCSMALTRRVLTLTGRMSLFRASIVTDPRFIYDVQHDHLDHWRLGRFKFLTGDDKSTWYSLMRLGWDTWYVPDAAIATVEHPPDKRFTRASRKLMFRWYGNSLRQNGRALALGPGRLGMFTYYCLLDQRVLMWTGLLGLALAIVASIKISVAALIGFAIWVLLTRLLMTFILIGSGHTIGPAYPMLLYYNQIVGSLMKIYVSFHLDEQSWTRQKTKLDRRLGGFQRVFNRWSSRLLMFSAVSVFAALVIAAVAAN
jgi:glycosyltransferase Alg8